MSFKVNPYTTGLKLVGGVCVSYAITWALIFVFVDTSALKNWLAPVHFFSDTPGVFYYVPAGGIFLLIAVVVTISSYVPDDYGDAREANLSEIKAMGCLSDVGVILGQLGSIFPQFIRTKEPLSTFLIAPPGTGKTAAIIIPNLFSCTNSMFINDVKCELWDKTSAQRAKMGRVGLFAPTMNLGKEDSLCFNPFAAECLPRTFGDQVDFVDQLISIIYPTGDNVSETTRYFNGNAKNLFMFWAMLRIMKDGETSLPRIYDDATETEDQQAAIASILENSKLPAFLEKKGFALLNMDTREFRSTATSFTQMLEPFNRPNIRTYFEACDFSYKDFRENKTFSLYCCIPPKDMPRMRPILKLMAQYLVLELLSNAKLYKKKTVTFVLDEFARLGKVEELIDAPELSRGCNMNFLFACQSVNQIRKIYNTNGGDAMQGLIDVCDYTLIYTQNDQKAAEYLSQTIGKTTKKKKSLSSKFGEITGTSNVSLEGIPFVTDQDLLNMGEDRMIVAVKGFKKRPIMGNKPWYYKDKKMAKLEGAFNGLRLGGDDEIFEETNDPEYYQEQIA